jgi:hypothetical protein
MTPLKTRNKDAPDAFDIGVLFEHLRRFCVVNIRWMARGTIATLFVLIVLHAVYPPSLEWVGRALHLAEPSLALILTLIVAVWLLERVITVQQEMKHPSLSIRARIRAYRQLSEIIEQRGAKRVDLLQLSGFTALRLLRDLAESHPKAEVRLLLLHPDMADGFDSDHQPDHRNRILTTIREVELMEKDYPGFYVQKRYYKTPPGLCSVAVDSDIVSVSWYVTFKDVEKPAVTRLRGHLSPAALATDDAAQAFLSFVRDQFDSVWTSAEESFEQARSSGEKVLSTPVDIK